MKKYRIILFVLGAVFFINAAVCAVISNMNAGLIMTALVGVFLLAVSVFYEKYKKYIPKAFRIFIAAGLILEAVFISVIYIYGAFDTVDCKEDAVIVLGSGIKGEAVPRNLAFRLDAAAEYHKKNPEAVIVVSGGQGNGENISEALAMERYLLKRGIPQEKIIKEDRSTSTEENFKFSKAILDRYFDGEYSVVYISNTYHILRAHHWAKTAGFDKISHYNGRTPEVFIIPHGIRESMGIVKQVIFG